MPMNNARWLLPLLLCSCAKGTPFDAPTLAPLVRASMPEAIRPIEVAALQRSLRELIEAVVPTAHAQSRDALEQRLYDLFKTPQPRVSGGSGDGIVDAAVKDLDGRFDSIRTRNPRSQCLSGPLVQHHVDLSSVSPSLDLVLSLQCHDLFGSGSGQTPDGSGAVFGRRSDGYSFWLDLKSTTGASDAMAYVANVDHPETSAKTVDFLFLEHSASIPRNSAFRLKAPPSVNHFELAYGASTPDRFGCGFQLISDGTLVYVSGIDWQQGQTCASAPHFDRCLSASDFTRKTNPADCAQLAATFSMGAPLSADLASAGLAIAAAQDIAPLVAQTGDFNQSGTVADGGRTQSSSFPDIATFQNASDRFLIDPAVIVAGHPYKGRNALDPHNGAHLHLSNPGNTWPQGGSAPSNYPAIYAVLDGRIDRTDTWFKVGDNYRYGLSLSFASSSLGEVRLEYSIEPMVNPGDAGFYEPFLAVTPGQTVHQGDVVAWMYLPPDAGTEPHIHFDLRNGPGNFLAPAIFTPTVVNAFFARWGQFGIDTNGTGSVTMPACMGYQLAADENPFGTTAVDTL